MSGAKRRGFKVGQVVTYRGTFKICQRTYVELTRFDEYGDVPAWYHSGGYSLENRLRALTKRERGA